MNKRIRFFALLLCLLVLLAPGAQAARWSSGLTMRLSTRTGPSTAYTEPGTFFSSWQGVTVDVLSKALSGSTWWVQVEFETGGKLYRAYTGAKRVAMDITAVPEEKAIGTGYILNATDVNSYYGPGTRYAPIPELVPAGASGTIVAAENGYVLFDFYDSRLAMQRRAWISDAHINISWYSAPPVNTYDPLSPGNHTGRSYYANDGSGICCQVVSFGGPGAYSYINIYAYGNNYMNIPVYMECSKFGSFATGEAAGNITFPHEGLFAELYFPTLGIVQAVQLLP